jgi:hypothetical protein
MLLLFSCIKNNNNIIEEKTIVGDTILDVEKIYSIEKIRDFIFYDLNINRRFNSIDELVLILNIINNYKMEIETSQNRHNNEVIDYFYNIESEQYNIGLFKNEYFTEYRIIFFEININENNYLNIFPYLTKNEYIKSNDFDKIYNINEYKDLNDFDVIYNINENIIEYMIDTVSRNEFCYLIFESGLLKSFRIEYHFL